ncbi:MAG: stage II sporulation protein M [Candidatus Woesearchaeota archaeon]|nr:MAG: stage II sporulation protein M [Candidatus Woesearchaeota archaeon]
MVLESLVNPKKAEGKPFELFFIGLVYSSVAMFLSLWIFKEQASLVMVFLTVLAAVPLIVSAIKLEEERDIEEEVGEKTLLKEHWRVISFLVFLFLGFVVSYSLWFIFLPPDITQTTFSTQISTIENINSQITASTVLGGVISPSKLLLRIFSNNVKVMVFAFLFSFFYGSGAIFILTWNASVIAAAIGAFVRNNISMYAASVGLAKVGGYFHILSLGLFRYFIHGIPEITAYFIAGLAGGIISAAVIRHDFDNKNFKRILYDSISLMVLAIFIVFIAALIEVYITPALF